MKCIWFTVGFESPGFGKKGKDKCTGNKNSEDSLRAIAGKGQDEQLKGKAPTTEKGAKGKGTPETEGKLKGTGKKGAIFGDLSEKGAGKDMEKGKGKDTEKGKGKDMEKGKGKDMELKGKGKDMEKGKGKDTEKGKGKDIEKGKSKDVELKGKGKDMEKGKGKDMEKGKGKDTEGDAAPATPPPRRLYLPGMSPQSKGSKGLSSRPDQVHLRRHQQNLQFQESDLRDMLLRLVAQKSEPLRLIPFHTCMGNTHYQ